MYPSNLPGEVWLALLLAIAAGPAQGQRDSAWFNDLAFPAATSSQAGQLAFDPATGQLLLLRDNGRTLAWNGTAIVDLGIVGPRLSGAAIATSMVSGYDGVLAFGGRSTTGFVSNQTLLFRGGAWSRRYPLNLPPARTNASMATLDQKPVLFGGIDQNGQELDDTWVLTPFGADGSWVRFLSLTPPPARHGAALCPDGTGGLLLFGGHSGTLLRGDTWRMGPGFAWSQVATTVTPPPGAGPMSFDPDRNEVLHVDPASGATFRFDPQRADWQALTAPQLTTSFAATTGSGPCHMAYDPRNHEHVFVAADAGLSVLSVADANVRHRQPAECSPHLAIDLAFGSPRLGGAYVLRVEGAVPGAPVWLGASARRLHLPGILPASNCLVFLTDWLMLLPEFASPSGAAWFAIGVPPDRDLVGFEVDHQAIDLWTLGVTDDLVARVARA